MKRLLVIVMLGLVAMSLACASKTRVQQPFLTVETHNNPAFWDQETQQMVLNSNSVDHSQGIMAACAEAVRNGQAYVRWQADGTFVCANTDEPGYAVVVENLYPNPEDVIEVKIGRFKKFPVAGQDYHVFYVEPDIPYNYYIYKDGKVIYKGTFTSDGRSPKNVYSRFAKRHVATAIRVPPR